MCGRSRGYMDTGNGNGEVGVKGVHWGSVTVRIILWDL